MNFLLLHHKASSHQTRDIENIFRPTMSILFCQFGSSDNDFWMSRLPSVHHETLLRARLLACHLESLSHSHQLEQPQLAHLLVAALLRVAMILSMMVPLADNQQPTAVPETVKAAEVADFDQQEISSPNDSLPLVSPFDPLSLALPFACTESSIQHFFGLPEANLLVEIKPLVSLFWFSQS